MLQCDQPFLTVLSFISVDILVAKSSSQLDSLVFSQDNSLLNRYLFFVNIKEVRSTLGYQPCLSSNSSLAFSVNEVLSRSDLKSFIMLDDHALFNGSDLLFNSWYVGTWPVDEPFVSRVSVFLSLCVFEVSNALNSKSGIVRNCSVWLVLLLEDLVDLKREGLRPLLVGSNLQLTESNLWLPEGGHDYFAFLVPDCRVSDNAIVSWRIMNHLDRPIDNLLMILKNKQLQTCIQFGDVGVQILDMHILVSRDLYVLTHKYLY